jgi:phosphoglycolate phosphatase
MGLELSDIAYVGDSGIDMAFAVNSGMTGLAVLWGYRSEQELIQNGAQKLVSHPRQILELLF